MDRAKMVRMIDKLNELRREARVLQGDSADDPAEYLLYPPATESEIRATEAASGKEYPDSFRTFLQIHNGWLGFWPDWSLMGVPREDNTRLYDDLKESIEMIPDVIEPETIEKLPELEVTNLNRIDLRNHAVLATDLNGSYLVFDRNHPGSTGEPQVVWVKYMHHVECRWDSFEALFDDAVKYTEENIARLRQEKG